MKQSLPMPQNVNNSAVGAAAAVTAKTKFRKSFTLSLENNLLKTEKRKIKMEFKAIYTKLVTKHLKKYNSLRVKFNAQGKVVRIEVLENGKWIFATHITQEFATYSVKPLRLQKETIVTIRK